MVLFLALAAFLMILSANKGDLGIKFADLAKIAPNTSYLATSPAALELIKTNEVRRLEGGNSSKIVRTASSESISIIAENEKIDSIVIPKIDAIVPIVVAQSDDSKQLRLLLDSGVVLYPGSAGFGNNGQTVLLGHSAPRNWPDIKNDSAFSRINELKPGDSVNIMFQGKTYSYLVSRSQTISKGGDLSGEPAGDSSLVLITSWPPGKDLERFAVEAIIEE